MKKRENNENYLKVNDDIYNYGFKELFFSIRVGRSR